MLFYFLYYYLKLLRNKSYFKNGLLKGFNGFFLSEKSNELQPLEMLHDFRCNVKYFDLSPVGLVTNKIRNTWKTNSFALSHLDVW